MEEVTHTGAQTILGQCPVPFKSKYETGLRCFDNLMFGDDIDIKVGIFLINSTVHFIKIFCKLFSNLTSTCERDSILPQYFMQESDSRASKKSKTSCLDIDLRTLRPVLCCSSYLLASVV